MKATTQIFGHSLDGNVLISNTALGHVKYTKNITYTGELEPLVGREWSGKGAGQKTSSRGVFFMPGTQFNEKLKMKLQDYGTFGIVS
ncbi:MAG: hypothetical protein U9N35_01500 [Euryarchaeota archaeon]|nr:hypothetical protein [Euryarchaeota archaeon]